MVYRRISADLKECGLSLWNRGWEASEICDILGISLTSLYRWRRIFREHGAVTRPPSPLIGRPRVLVRVVTNALRDLLLDDPDFYLDELILWLALHHDITISRSALQRNLEDVGLTRKVLMKIAAERNEVARAEYQEMLGNRELFSGDGSEFVCLDETSKNELTFARTHGRSLRGERAVLRDVFVRGDRYSALAAITVDGYLAAHVAPGSIDSFEFYQFVQEQVLPHMNPYPAERSVLVLDNCRIHHNEALVDLVTAAGCLILYLPPYSPDFNPIEESFSSLKAYIRRHGAVIHRGDDPVAALYEAFGHITEEKAKGWFKHAGYIRVY